MYRLEYIKLNTELNTWITVLYHSCAHRFRAAHVLIRCASEPEIDWRKLSVLILIAGGHVAWIYSCRNISRRAFNTCIQADILSLTRA